MTAGLHRVENEDGLVEWAAGEPGSATRGRVRSYIGYRESAPAPVHRWETPAGEVSLIISLGPGFRAQAVPDADELSEFTSFVVGMHDRPSRTAHDGRQLGMQVRLDPLGAFSLFGVPLHELGNRVVELSDLLGADAARWTEMLLAARHGRTASRCSTACWPPGWPRVPRPPRNSRGRGGPCGAPPGQCG